MNRIEISVVEHDGEKFFKTGDLLFDQMSAEEEFEGGKLTITRDSQILDQTEEIRYYGTHAATTCFMGLRKLFPDESPGAYAVASLVPEQFEVGDTLVLEINQEGSYANHLRAMVALEAALIGALEENPDGITLGELNNKLPSLVTEQAKSTTGAEIVRFRSKK